MDTFTSGIAGEDIADGEVVAGLTADGRLYAKPPTDWTGPIINTHEYGKPMSGEMVYYPRPTHPLEEENQRLRHEIERLREVEKDSTDLHNIVKKQWSNIKKLKYIIEEMFKICPCMCNTALDYECAKCEARRILEGMKDD